MAGLREIRTRLKSVENTRKITRAMKLVSAAKLKKAQDAVTSARDYNEALAALLRDLLPEVNGLDFEHPLMKSSAVVKRVRFLVVGGSRGLCGSFNTRINKEIDAVVNEYQARGATVDLHILGKKSDEYARRRSYKTAKSVAGLAEDALLWPIDEICDEISAAFTSNEIDEVHLIYTKFKSAISSVVMREKLLPMEAEIEGVAPGVVGRSGITRFEPSAKAVFSAMLPRILRTKVRQAALDSKASEHGSRMTAMDSATKNAQELIRNLTRLRNRMRQAGITGELLDIIGGAAATEG